MSLNKSIKKSTSHRSEHNDPSKASVHKTLENEAIAVHDHDHDHDHDPIVKTETHEELINNLEDENEELEQELVELQIKHNNLIKNGNLEESTKKFIEELEGDLRTAIEEAQRYKKHYESLTQSNQKYKAELKQKEKAYEELLDKLRNSQNQLERAHQLI